MASDSKLLLWEYEPGIADLTERQQELCQDLAFLIERRYGPLSAASAPEESARKTEATIGATEADLPSPLPPRLAEERARLDGLLSQADTMKTQLEAADNYLADLLSTLRVVQEKTDALYGDCEDLVQVQQKMTTNADTLRTKMEPLLEYDRLAVQLNAPGLSVTADGFFATLDRLQRNMAYVAANPEFKEAGLFRTRYFQLFSKAAALIRNEVDRSFQKAVTDVLAASRSVQLTGEAAILNAFSVLYSTFQQSSGSVRSMLKNVDERRAAFPDIYTDLIQDCHQLYFAARSKLLDPFIQTCIADFRKNSQQNTTELLRVACSFLIRICREEFRLYYQYFSQSSPVLSDFLTGKCQVFYDGIRPEIIHLDQVEKISDVCCFLNQEMLREHGVDVSVELSPFVEFVRTLLADSRERLMFRVNAFIGAEIVAYKAGRGDLAYPEKLEILHQLLETSKEEARNRMSSRASVSSISSRVMEERYLFSAESQGFWYPTLRRAVGFLSKLYQSLDPQSFKVVAQEVIFRTLESLSKAADQLLKSKGSLHCDLFLVSHILVLREHLTIFQVDLSTEEDSLNFGRVVGTARNILTRKTSILSLNSRNALLELFFNTAPELRTNTVDCRKEVDVQLRTVCLRLVDHVAGKIVGPLPEFLDKADVVLSMEKPNSPVKLRNQLFATPEEVKAMVAVVYKNIKTDLPGILTQFLLYLISVDTQFVLYKPVKLSIWKQLERLNAVLMQAYSEDDRALIGVPSLEQWNVMLNIPSQKLVFSPLLSRSVSSSSGAVQTV